MPEKNRRGMFKNKFYPKAITWIILTLLFFSLIYIQPPSQGIIKTTFTDGSNEKIITFPTGGGIDNSINISITFGTQITAAKLNLTSQPVGGKYPSNVLLDVGIDGDYDWAFTGVGYGDMGNQYVFADGLLSASNQFSGNPSDILNSNIQLPKNAEILNAVMNISGASFEFANINSIDPNLGRVYNCELDDIDGDGDLDAIVNYFQSSFRVIWLENTAGDGSSWTNHNIATTGLNWAYGLAVSDLDNDNDTDVVVTNNAVGSRDIFWYNNTNGVGTAWTRHVVDTVAAATGTMYQVSIADMNNDSFNDTIVSASNNDPSMGNLFWYPNNGNGTFGTQQIINQTTAWLQSLYVADIDSDGDNDTVAAASWGNLVLWCSNEDGNGTSWSDPYIVNNSLSRPRAITVDDLDEDGNPDIGIIGNDETIWVEAPDDPTNVSGWVQQAHYIGPGSGATGQVGAEIVFADFGYDWDGHRPDGKLDVVIACTPNNDVAIYQSDGTPIDGGWNRIILNRNHVGANFMAIGDINNDTYNDTLVGSSAWSTVDDLIWYELIGGSPSDVELNLGGDAFADWVEPSVLNYTTELPDFSTNLTQYIAQATSNKDQYDNELVTIPLSITSSTPGQITIDDLKIEYNYTATVDVNPHGNLAQELTEALESIPPGDDGNCSIPMKFVSASAGKLKVHDLFIEFNEFPWFTSELPNSFELPEDSMNTALLDLSTYVADDYIEPNELIFDISYTGGPGKDVVAVGIYNDIYLGADSFTGTQNDNWTGYIDFIVNVTDNLGSTIESDMIRLNVTPVNDEPIAGPDSYPNLIIPEGGTSKPLDLDSHQYFIDVDNDPLFFNVVIDPDNVLPDENLSMNYDTQINTVTFKANGDWFGTDIPIRIYCDDSEPVNLTLYKDFKITILNINDPPIWNDIPDMNLMEDEITLDAINLTNYITDPDDVVENITFSLVSNSAPDSVSITINDRNYIDIYPIEPEFVGTTSVIVRATDPGQNYSDESFEILYQAVNDPPVINLVSPTNAATVESDTVILTWEAEDIDSAQYELSYTVYFGTNTRPGEMARGVSEKQFIVSDLEENTNYYWQVLATDGIGNSFSNTHTFTIDLSTQPEVGLILPKSDATFPNTDVKFDWEIFVYQEIELTYEFYLATDPDPTINGPWASGLTKTELEVTGLTANQTYYWTVLPKFETGYGVCRDGVLKFTIDPTKVAFGLDITTITELKLHQGKTSTFEVEIINHGTTDEVIRLTILPESIGNNIIIDVEGPISLEAERGRKIQLTIDTANITKGEYQITIKATSDITPANAQTEISLIVKEPKEKEEDNRLFKSYMDWLPFLILLIIGIIGTAIIIRYKPKPADVDFETDLRAKLAKDAGFGTEISYRPPLSPVKTPWQPQVAGTEQVPAIGISATAPELPQLPPRQTYPPSEGTPYPPEEPSTTAYDTGPTPAPAPEPGIPETGGEPFSDLDLDVKLPEEISPIDETKVIKLEDAPVMEPLEPETVPPTEGKPEPEKLGLLPEDIEEMMPVDESEPADAERSKKKPDTDED